MIKERSIGTVSGKCFIKTSKNVFSFMVLVPAAATKIKFDCFRLVNFVKFLFKPRYLVLFEKNHAHTDIAEATKGLKLGIVPKKGRVRRVTGRQEVNLALLS